MQPCALLTFKDYRITLYISVGTGAAAASMPNVKEIFFLNFLLGRTADVLPRVLYCVHDD